MASLILDSFSARTPAALAYSGVRALQCPHLEYDYKDSHIRNFSYRLLPRSIKFHQDKVIAIDHLLEVGLGEDQDPILSRNLREGGCHAQK